MLKKCLVIFGAVFLSLLSPVSGFADEVDPVEIQDLEAINTLKEKEAEVMSQIEPGASVIIAGKEQHLYPTFSNQEEALNKLKKAIPDFLELLSTTYNLEEIDDTNWAKYVDYANEYASVSISKEDDMQYDLLMSFVDIYENKSKNDTIKKMISELDDKEISNKNNEDNIANETSLLQDIIFALPYTNELAFEQNEIQLQQTAPAITASFDLSRAMQYVNLYALEPNSSGFGQFSNDCTNFASQILYAGNVRQEDYYPDEARGWWHRIVTSSGPIIYPEHKYSISWIQADTFARYMGVGFTTSDHYSFSSKLQAGDFIAYDKYRDGDWNHIGFVTAVDSKSGTYNGYTYYDYKVAQHTTNYHAWTSSSTNGWETLSNVTYGRVRR
ncbi:amidase domain-containing protein [Paenibacillus macerans]|uniref:amidase domain-containing protein n=1 Tax=Paenibacillus macerans TaxID=44252 RepID=UPI00203B34F6|nr:amidase domain-containing protein [Paenibacillus macerans]MCM3702882.1 amidase domain-containing protein [Paenibacillus macerans]